MRYWREKEETTHKHLRNIKIRAAFVSALLMFVFIEILFFGRLGCGFWWAINIIIIFILGIAGGYTLRSLKIYFDKEIDNLTKIEEGKYGGASD